MSTPLSLSITVRNYTVKTFNQLGKRFLCSCDTPSKDCA